MKEITRIERQQLLILDNFGIQPFDAPGRATLMETIEDRYGKASIIITSQLPASKWYEVIEKNNLDTILGRIIHDAHRLELKGESLRRKWNKKGERENTWKKYSIVKGNKYLSTIKEENN